MSALSNLKKSISTFDAAWEESSHKRAANGQFGSGGSSSGKGGKAAPAKKEAAKPSGSGSLGKGSRYGMTAQQNSNPKHQMARNGGMLHGNPAKHKEQAAELLKEHNEMQKSLERIKGKGNISEEQLLGSAIKARKQAIEAHNKAAIR